MLKYSVRLNNDCTVIYFLLLNWRKTTTRLLSQPKGTRAARTLRKLPRFAHFKANRDLTRTMARDVIIYCAWRHDYAASWLEVAMSSDQSTHLLREIRTVHARSFTWELFIAVISNKRWKGQTVYTISMYTFLNISVE